MKRLASNLRGTCIENPLQSTQFIKYLTGLTLVLGSFGAHAAPAPVYNTTAASLYYVNNSSSSLISDPVYASYNYPYLSGTNAGYAGLSGSGASNVPVVGSGVYADSSNGGWVQTQASYQTSMLVGSGNSGLAIGDAVTLQLSLQLDGTTSVTTGEDAGFTNMSFNYRIKAPDQQYDSGEGWSAPTLINFSADVNHNANNFFTYYYGDPGGAWYHDITYTAGWSWNSTLASGNGGDVDDYELFNGQSLTASDSKYFDTGVVLINFETYVGDTLNIDSYFDVWGDTYGAGSVARADFLNSMRAGIASPYVTGLDLVYGDVKVVPVPAAAWLFVSGLLGLIAASRRSAV